MVSDNKNKNVYVGHRYVPKICGVWDKLKTYEGLSIVTWEGTSYTSKKRVPEGVDILNDEYWTVTGNYNAQVENYRQEVRDMQDEVDSKVAQDEFDDSLNSVNQQLVQIDDSLNSVNQQLVQKATIIISKSEPLYADDETFWYEDKGESVIDSGVIIKNAIVSDDEPFDKNFGLT